MSKIYQNRGGTLTLVSDDDNAVHKTGNETIAGTKTFSSTITGSVSGNAGTATQFSANTTVALTGDATGTSAGSKKGWSVPVTLSNSGVTAGSYGPSANATPGYGATFNVPYITVDAKGRVTAAATHTVKIPASDNADVKVTQTVSTDNAELPILTKASNATSTVTDTSKFAAAVKINPSTGTLTATKFVGPLTGNVTGNCSGSSGSCTGTASKATGDADGNAIKTTYAKLASPALTGTPTAPTAAFGTNTTQIATTAFVYNNAAKHLGAATNIYVAKAATGNGSGSNTSNYMSLADLRNYLATVHMHSSTADLNGSYNLQLLFKAGESFGNATFDATKMPGVRNLILNTSTGTASTTSNYSTNSPTFGSITVTGDIAVTIRNINCTGRISAQWGAYIAIDTYVAASSFSAVNNGYLNVAKNMTIDVCDAHTDYLFNASTNGIIAMWPGATITINFRQQCYYTRALFASSGNGTMWLGYSSLKLTGTQPIAVWGGSGTLTGTSETAAGTAAKAVVLASGQTFTLTTNATAKVKFTNDNTAANPTLNINSTGAKALWWNGAAVAANMIMKNIAYDVKYDGTHFVIQNAVKRLTNNDFGIFRYAGNYNQTYNSGSWNFTGWNLYYGTGVENGNWRGSHIGNIQQNVTTSNKTFPILFSGTENATANTSTYPYFGSGVKINPSTSTIYATTFSGGFSGNASSATEFSAAKSVTLTGDVTGTASSKAGWSVATTLANSGVTAGSYGPSANATPAYGATFNVPYITVDAKGRVTAASTKTVKIPAADNTDTKNTAGSTDSSSKLFLIGATSQAANPQTYSHDTAYVGTDGCLYSGGTKVLTAHQSLSNYLTKTTNVSEMGRYIDMHYDNATSKYDYDVRLQVNSQGTAAGGGVLQIVGASVKASKFEGPLTGNASSATKVSAAPAGTTYVAAVTAGNANVTSTATGFGAVWNAPVKEYRVGCATYPSSNNQILWYSVTNANVSAGTNTINKSMNWDGGTGILTATGFSGPLTGNVTGNCSGSSGSCTGNAKTATTLQTARYIDGVSFNGSADIAHYASCSTAAGTAAKTAAITGFALKTGAKATIKFTVANTAASPTMNINSTGAKSIATIPASGIEKNKTYELVYNGSSYDVVGSNESVPVGSIIWSARTTAPAGYLICDGTAVSRTTYADLFAAIGTKYGTGNGSSTFNLPNLIDKFPQGSQTANVGTAIAAGLPNIKGDFTPYTEAPGYQHDAPVGAFYVVNATQKGFGNDGTDNDNERIGFDASRSNAIYGKSNTVQPPALKLLPCIKAYGEIMNTGSLDASKLATDMTTLASDLRNMHHFSTSAPTNTSGANGDIWFQYV